MILSSFDLNHKNLTFYLSFSTNYLYNWHVSKIWFPANFQINNKFQHNLCVCLVLSLCVLCFKCDSNFAAWEVLREDEFSPLKNADGAKKDTPTTSREDLCNLHQRYIQRAGGQILSQDGSTVQNKYVLFLWHDSPERQNYDGLSIVGE